jgi:hypothetical protein
LTGSTLEFEPKSLEPNRPFGLSKEYNKDERKGCRCGYPNDGRIVGFENLWRQRRTGSGNKKTIQIQNNDNDSPPDSEPKGYPRRQPIRRFVRLFHEWSRLMKNMSRILPTGSFSSPGMSTPMRRRAITGHAAALPSPAMNSRRRIGHASVHRQPIPAEDAWERATSTVVGGAIYCRAWVRTWSRAEATADGHGGHLLGWTRRLHCRHQGSPCDPNRPCRDQLLDHLVGGGQ